LIYEEKSFKDIMISRRDFLVTLARLAATVGGAGMILVDPDWQRFLLGGDSGLAFGDTYLDELVRLAPKAATGGRSR